MVFLDDLKEMALYKKPFVLPIDEENIRKGSAIFLVSPNAEISKAMMNYPYIINKMNTFNSYYLEKNANYYINQEGNLISIDRDDEYLHEVSEEELEELEDPEPEPYCMKESKDNSKYDSSFKKKTGKNFKYIQFPGAEAEKYLSNDSHWNKESIDDFKKRKVGEVAIDTEADAVAGWIFVNKSGTVGPLRVYDEYKGYGISNILVADAVSKYKGKELGVYSDNEIAMKVYEKNGFRTYRTKTYKDGDKVYIMRLDESACNRETTAITEAHDFEKYNPNFKKKTGGNFEFIDIHDAKAQEYLASDKYYNKQIKKYISIINGEIVVDKDTGKVAGAIYVGGGNRESNRNYGFIQTLEVYKPYRGYGLSNKLLDDAIKKYNAVDLTVYKGNNVASELYKKHGFVIIGAGNTKHSDYWMKLKSKLTEEDKKHMEAFNEAGKSIPLTNAERASLSDSDFGIPSQRRYPMTDASHVKSAIRFFNYVDKDHEAELAKNIKRKAIEFKVPIRCGEGNRLSKYITEEYVQEFMSVASIGNDMTAVCNGTIRQHMSQGDMVYSFDHQKPYTKKTKKKKDEPVTESEDSSLPDISESEGHEDVFFDDMIKDIEKFCNEEPEPFPTDILNEKKG